MALLACPAILLRRGGGEELFLVPYRFSIQRIEQYLLHALSIFIFILLLASSAMRAAQAEEILSLDDAVRRSLNAAYSLKAHQASLHAAKARIDQADKRPNPNLSVTLEDFTGTGAYSELDRSQLTVSYEQKLERGGKRQARKVLAEQNRTINRLQAQQQVLTTVYDVELEFRRIQALQARLLAVQKQKQLALDLKKIIEQRRSRGRDSDVAVDNADIRLLRIEAEQLQLERELLSAKQLMSQRWVQDSSSSAFPFDVEQNSFINTSAIAPDWEDAIVRHPGIVRWQAEQQRAQASMVLAQAKTKQDPTLSAGLRYLQQNEDVALVLGVSMPLALLNKNRGNIQAAAAEKEAAYWWQQDQVNALRRDYERSHALAKQSAQAVAQLTDQLLPRANQASEKVLQRRRVGAASDLEVYSAQSLAAELQLQLIAQREQFHMAMAGARYATAQYIENYPEWFDGLLESSTTGVLTDHADVHEQQTVGGQQ